MTSVAAAKVMSAARWLWFASVVLCNVLFAGVFLGSGILTGKLGLIVCGAGWSLIAVPICYWKHPAKELTRWPVIVGATGLLVFMLGLAVHAGAL